MDTKFLRSTRNNRKGYKQKYLEKIGIKNLLRELDEK
jgi:hypothetical protein